MKAILVFVIFIAGAANSQRRIIDFKKSYKSYPDTISTSVTYDEAWKRIILMMGHNNFIGRVLDKTTGIAIIQLDNANLTAEDKNGDIDPTGWMIVQRVYDVPTNRYYQAETGSVIWSTRLVSLNNGSQVIIDSVNLISSVTISGLNYVWTLPTKNEVTTEYRSTEKFAILVKSYLIQ